MELMYISAAMLRGVSASHLHHCHTPHAMLPVASRVASDGNSVSVLTVVP